MRKIVTIQIEGCIDCPYCKEESWNGTSTNVPRHGDSKCDLRPDNEDPLTELEDNGFPSWCPLLDHIPGPVWGDADWGLPEEE